MPARSPFTRLCQSAAAASGKVYADLHVHSTASDGLFTRVEVMEHARRAGLSAVAITDHDTLDAHHAGPGNHHVELIPGVEISTSFHGRELHLLAYFIDIHDTDLLVALGDVRRQRRERIVAMAERLRSLGLTIPSTEIDALLDAGATLGRRHLARLLVESRQVGNVYEAFTRYLGRPEFGDLPKARIDVVAAIELVHGAGGITSWAHPSSHTNIEMLIELRSAGLDAVESEYPWSKPSHGRVLRAMAETLDLAITGGSDCHGPWPAGRMIGSRGVDRSMFHMLRPVSVTTN